MVVGSSPTEPTTKGVIAVSCYFRHLKDIFAEAGIEVNASNRKQIDQAIHQFAGVNYKDCPSTWRLLKQELITNEKKRQELIARVKAAVK